MRCLTELWINTRGLALALLVEWWLPLLLCYCVAIAWLMYEVLVAVTKQDHEV